MECLTKIIFLTFHLPKQSKVIPQCEFPSRFGKSATFRIYCLGRNSLTLAQIKSFVFRYLSRVNLLHWGSGICHTISSTVKSACYSELVNWQIILSCLRCPVAKHDTHKHPVGWGLHESQLYIKTLKQKSYFSLQFRNCDYIRREETIN